MENKVLYDVISDDAGDSQRRAPRASPGGPRQGLEIHLLNEEQPWSTEREPGAANRTVCVSYSQAAVTKPGLAKTETHPLTVLEGRGLPSRGAEGLALFNGSGGGSFLTLSASGAPGAP